MSSIDQLPGSRNPEKIESAIPPELRRVLDAHIVDLPVASEGRKELMGRIGDAPLGAAEAMIGRTDPAITVESITVQRGKSRVLIGPNGAGKSTVFDAFMERGAHFETNAGRGCVVVGKPVHAREQLRIARLDQEELLDAIGDSTAGDVLRHAAEYFKQQFPINWEDADKYDENLSNQDAHVRIEELMGKITQLFDIEPFLETDVKNLSGGERTKLALFMVLVSEPDVLLLDEPTNHLDLRSIAKLTELFAQYNDAGIAIVSVSHVHWFLEDAGRDGVIEISWDDKGRRVHESNAPYTKYVKDASRERSHVIAGDIEWVQEDYDRKNGATLVEVPQHVTIPDSPLRDVSFPNISGGDIVMCTGDNGTGKTRLMEALVRGDHGPTRAKGAKIAYLPQFWPEEIVRGTLDDFFQWVKQGTNPNETGSAAHKQKPARNFFIEQAKELHFGGSSRIGESWLKRPFARFSGGEQRLLWFLAVSALRDVDMMVLDEPTNHMDRALQERVMKAIRDFPGATVLSTHDRTLMTDLSRNAGKTQGAQRLIRHVVFERKGDRTTMHPNRESVDQYITRIIREARQHGKRIQGLAATG